MIDTVEHMRVRNDALQVGDLNRAGSWVIVQVIRESHQITVTWRFLGLGPTTGMSIKKVGDLSVSHYDLTHHMEIQRHVTHVTEEDLYEMRNSLESWLHG